MKKFLLGVVLAATVSVNSFADWNIFLINYSENPDVTPGLFWINTGAGNVLMNDPPYRSLHMQLFTGRSPTSLSLFETFLDDSFISTGLLGVYFYPDTVTLPDLNTGEIGYFKIRVWLPGDDRDWDSAVAHNAIRGESGVFPNPIGWDQTLINMPDIFLSQNPVPEPGTLMLAGLGAVALLALRRRK